MLDLAHRFAGRAGRTKFLWRQRAAMCQSWLACPARVAVRAQRSPFPLRASSCKDLPGLGVVFIYIHING